MPTGERGESLVVQVSRPATAQASPDPIRGVDLPDLERISANVAQQQVQEQVQRVQDHGVHLRKVSRRSEELRRDMAEIRWWLIQKRIEQLESWAKKHRWSSTKGPAEGTRLWEDYREWRYLQGYIKEALVDGLPDLILRPEEMPEKGDKIEVPTSPKHPSRKPSVKKEGYKPQWMRK
jgi:hypothetical protein